jgi:protein phosphatase
MAANFEKVDIYGNPPLPRFGHTITYISKGKAILFGGATGDTVKYQITSDTYSLDTQSKLWKKVETFGPYPSPRAAHSSVAVEQNQMVVYGGATGGGSLASDDLYLLDLREGDGTTGTWTIVPVVGPTPGRRYGHTLTYSRPYLVVFAGNTGQEPVNDFWCLNVD